MNTNSQAQTSTGTIPINLKPERLFLRFDWIYRDAVQSRKRSKLIEVLLRLQLPGAKARRMADNILSESSRG